MRLVVAGYVFLLVISFLVRDPDPHLNHIDDDELVIQLSAVEGDSVIAGTDVRFVYRDQGPRDSAVVFILHGSPGDNGAVRRVASGLAERYRVIAPDLPGFGGSSRSAPDYSIRAHAVYLSQLMDSLEIDQAHFVGFSMGGGVLLSLYDQEPDRVASAIMLAAIGVQEMELMGEYYLNHAVHGLQLAGLWLLREGFPHMGLFDQSFLSVEYARNFYDTDQRPLRDILKRFEPPMLILHGDQDPLVVPAAAREHHRLVPQSEMVMFEGNHFMIFMRPGDITPHIMDWVGRHDAGSLVRLGAADSARVASSILPMADDAVPPAKGFTLVIMMALIIAATLVLEDLTCIGAGLMVARGTIGFFPATMACIVGLYIGDVLLYFAGRFLGRRALRLIPFRWMISAEDVERSSTWFRRRGLAFVFVSRFSPGTRLPTYFAAGVLRTSFWKFSVFFLGAIVIWTPLLVGLSSVFGGEMRMLFGQWQGGAVWAVLLTIVLFLLVIKVVIPAFTWKGRRLLHSRVQRLRRWEFWPAWLFYIPVVGYVLWLCIRYRSFTLFTAANPSMKLGGFIGESKSRALEDVRRVDGSIVPPSILLSDQAQDQPALALAFIENEGGGYPVVLKPDVGERGRGVVIVQSEDQLRKQITAANQPVILQAYRGGLEFGVFYYRHPSSDRGTVFSITDKRFPSVTGDGTSTVEQLILRDPRAVLSAKMFLRRHASDLATTPASGERFELAQLGTHSRGALFLDGIEHLTEALTDRIDQVCQGMEGFTFGRFDIRVPTVRDFRAGENLQVIELNGVTSEATHIYDPSYSLFHAYRTLFSQWRILFEIAAEQRTAGVKPDGLWAVGRALFRRLEEKTSAPG